MKLTFEAEFFHEKMTINDFIKELKQFSDSSVEEKESFYIDSLKLKKNKLKMIIKVLGKAN